MLLFIRNERPGNEVRAREELSAIQEGANQMRSSRGDITTRGTALTSYMEKPLVGRDGDHDGLDDGSA